MSQKVFHSDPDIMGGKPVFQGTRVPASYLFDYLGSGESVEVFLDHYPTVSKQAAMAALKSAASLVEQDAHLAR